MPGIYPSSLQRRNFLAGSLAVGAMAASPGIVRAAGRHPLLDKIISVDIHSHPYSILEQIKNSQLTAFAYSVVADSPMMGSSRGQLEMGIRALQNESIEIATSAADIENAKKSNTKAALLAIEGGDFAEGKLDAIEEMYEIGVRVIQPVHRRSNLFADSQQDKMRGEGLSDTGKEFIRELDRLGIVTDVAHMTEEAVRRTTEITSKPLILSHVIHVKTRDALADWNLTRKASPEYSKLVADTGGVIGVWNLTRYGLHSGLAYFSEKEMFVDTFRYLADTFGVEHVTLGSDLGDHPASHRDRSPPALLRCSARAGPMRREVFRSTAKSRSCPVAPG